MKRTSTFIAILALALTSLTLGIPIPKAIATGTKTKLNKQEKMEKAARKLMPLVYEAYTFHTNMKTMASPSFTFTAATK